MKGLMLLPLLAVLVVSVCYVEASPAVERDTEEKLLNLLTRVLDDQDKPAKEGNEWELKKDWKDQGAAKEEQVKKDGLSGQGAAKEEQMKKDVLPGQVKKDGQPGQLVEKAENGMETILEERQQTLCPEGWVYHGSSCYKPINIAYTYQAAQYACEQEDALSYVAVANDAAENAFVDSLVFGGEIWLGCTAFGGNHLWTCPDGSGKTYNTYTRTASPADSYWNWAPSQPMINGEQCQVQYQRIGEWHDYPCSSTFRVVCELAVPDELRLVGGNDRYEGRVEVCRAGSCGTVCDDGWGQEEAAVVCRELGYSYSAASAYSYAAFGQGYGPIFYDDVVCTGAETNIASCSSRGWGIHNCVHSEDAGVRCQGNGDLRLVGGTAAGRVEVLYNDEWGTICDDSWDAADAQVVCRQLGLPYSNARVETNAYYGPGSGRIWLDDVSCTGSEGRLDQCGRRNNQWGSHNCGHYEDAVVFCA